MIFKKENINNICSNYLKPLWLQTSKDFPDKLSEIFAEDVKIKNEAFMQDTGDKMSEHFEKMNSKQMKLFPFYRKKWGQRMEELMKEFFIEEPVLGIRSYLSLDTLTDVMVQLKKFLSLARKFDPDLTVADLGQAVRNYLVYTMFLEMLDKKQSCTSAIFGYSMLYPITDNFIDSKKSIEEKREYNNLIQDKIKGMPTKELSIHDTQTCRLLSEIEATYPRDSYEDIYGGLLQMLEAQRESLIQQKDDKILSMEERLDISLYKGGVSVLIDRYMADEDVDEADMIFYLGFGFVLQLADDLQDITSDLTEHSQTLFTLEQEYDKTEMLVNQLINFTHQLFSNHKTEKEHFQRFMLRCSIYLILMSVQMSQEHFHKEYLQKLENYFPVHFEFLNHYIKNSALYPEGLKEEDFLRGLDFYLNMGTTA